MSSQSDSLYEFWAKAVNTTVYLIKKISSSVIHILTLFKLRHKRMDDYGCGPKM